VTRSAAPVPDLAAQLRGLVDRLEREDPRDVAGHALGARETHQHEPGILRDTVLCPACAATVRTTARA